MEDRQFKKNRLSGYYEMKLYFLLILRCREVNSIEFVLTLLTESKSESDDRSCMGSLAGVSIECKYAGWLVERA